MDLSDSIKQKALDIGFDLVGITSADPIDKSHIAHLNDWLALGCAGRMDYMKRNLEKRINPAKLLQNARSVICVGLNYKPPSSLRGRLVLRSLGEGGRPKQSHPHYTSPTAKIANYAQYEDYHLFIKKQLHKLADFISSLVTGQASPARREDDFKFKICVDSAPIAERALAARAGLGFIGKNRMLINPRLGLQILLGEIITTLKLKTDEPIADTCSACNKCIEACPTAALAPGGRLDANKCISYLTIEYKDQIPADLAEKIGAHLFGCDECLLACPYNDSAPVCKNANFIFYSDRAFVDLKNILEMTEHQFNIEFADSPIKRLGFDLLKRNAQICLDNSAKR